VQVRAFRATGPASGTWLEALMRQQVGFGQFVAGFEVVADIDDMERSSFTAPRWRAEAGIARGFDRWMVHVGGGVLRRGGSTLGRAAAGLSWRY
ncbi:MAG: hypothetical protein KFH98_09300, partial [Gemmatimonadetes bacterium]|nr:hypothetical protein [Gemmatimonadota bacterium]